MKIVFSIDFQTRTGEMSPVERGWTHLHVPRKSPSLLCGFTGTQSGITLTTNIRHNSDLNKEEIKPLNGLIEEKIGATNIEQLYGLQ